jgi:hypothetical protein
MEIIGDPKPPTAPARSGLPDTRNPLITLPAANEIASLPWEAQLALKNLLKQIAMDARDRADHAWRKRKGPMAAYWRAVSVYANHTQRLIKPPALN